MKPIKVYEHHLSGHPFTFVVISGERRYDDAAEVFDAIAHVKKRATGGITASLGEWHAVIVPSGVGRQILAHEAVHLAHDVGHSSADEEALAEAVAEAFAFMEGKV